MTIVSRKTTLSLLAFAAIFGFCAVANADHGPRRYTYAKHVCQYELRPITRYFYDECGYKRAYTDYVRVRICSHSAYRPPRYSHDYSWEKRFKDHPRRAHHEYRKYHSRSRHFRKSHSHHHRKRHGVGIYIGRGHSDHSHFSYRRR